MPVIGITGGIATGKSLVTRLFQERGATTFSADDAARAVLTPGGPTLQEIARTFGEEMLRPDGALDRARLGQKIFADPAAREALNRTMHPPILRLLHAQIEAAREDLPPTALIVVEMPLLFEAHLQDWFDAIVVVTASEASQIARLRARNGLDEAEARRRLAAQWPMADKIARADFVIENEGTPEQTAEAVEALWNRLTSPNPLLRKEGEPSSGSLLRKEGEPSGGSLLHKEGEPSGGSLLHKEGESQTRLPPLAQGRAGAGALPSPAAWERGRG